VHRLADVTGNEVQNVHRGTDLGGARMLAGDATRNGKAGTSRSELTG
jgi:hypothetical protein